MKDNSLGDPLYFIYAIQRSPYGFNLKWKHIKPLISYMFGDEIFEKLRDGRVTIKYRDQEVNARMQYMQDQNYPLMYLEE